MSTKSIDDSIPPSEALPAYTNKEPATLPRLMFIIGFFFPLCWFVGALFLSSRLRSIFSPEVKSGKTDEEKTYVLDRKRSAEVKWAKWCLGAFVVAIVMAIALTAGICTWLAGLS